MLPWAEAEGSISQYETNGCCTDTKNETLYICTYVSFLTVVNYLQCVMDRLRVGGQEWMDD